MAESVNLESMANEKSNRKLSGINSVELWDWPFNESGFVKCNRDDKKFIVALDFKSLKAVDLKVNCFLSSMIT